MMANIKYGTFLFFGSSLVLGICFVFFFMPETKGLSLEEMDILFNISGLGNKKRAKADKMIEDIRTAEALVGDEMKNNLEHEHLERSEGA
jgi:hypothetical protein